MNGWLVKQRLLELQLTPEQFAGKAGFCTTTAYKMLSGGKVSDRNLFKAAKALKLKPTELLHSEPIHSVRRAGAAPD